MGEPMLGKSVMAGDELRAAVHALGRGASLIVYGGAAFRHPRRRLHAPPAIGPSHRGVFMLHC